MCVNVILRNINIVNFWFGQTRDELEAAGELPEVTDPYVYEQHIDIDEDEENEDSLHKFYLKVRPWPKLGLMNTRSESAVGIIK